jgi:hypothetical protein
MYFFFFYKQSNEYAIKVLKVKEGWIQVQNPKWILVFFMIDFSFMIHALLFMNHSNEMKENVFIYNDVLIILFKIKLILLG